MQPMNPDAHALSVLGILWHRVTPIVGASVLIVWGLTRCVNLLSM